MMCSAQIRSVIDLTIRVLPTRSMEISLGLPTCRFCRTYQFGKELVVYQLGKKLFGAGKACGVARDWAFTGIPQETRLGACFCNVSVARNPSNVFDDGEY